MSNKKIRDERVIQFHNKIQSEALNLVLILLVFSVFAKTYVLHLPVSNCVTEVIIMIAVGIYLAVRSYFGGFSSVDTMKYGKKSIVFLVLTASIVGTIFIAIRNYDLYGDKYSGVFDAAFIAAVIVSFISLLFQVSIIVGVILAIEKLGKKRLERKMEHDELDD